MIQILIHIHSTNDSHAYNIHLNTYMAEKVFISNAILTFPLMGENKSWDQIPAKVTICVSHPW